MSNEELDSDSVKLQGDTIGRTLYSERWVLRMMMRLSKLSEGDETFDNDFEENLCFLWDMTSEEDVVMFVKPHGMFDLLLDNIKKAEGVRLMEILVGVLGNLCAFEAIRNAYGRREDFLNIIMDLLTVPDARTLVQVVRIMTSFAYQVCNDQKYSAKCKVGRKTDHKKKGQELKQRKPGNPDYSKSKECDAGSCQQVLACNKNRNFPSHTNVTSTSTLINDHSLSCHEGPKAVVGSNEPSTSTFENECYVSCSKEPKTVINNQLCTKSLKGTNKLPCKASHSCTKNVGCEDYPEINTDTEYSGNCSIWYNTFINVEIWLPKIVFILNSSKNLELLEVSLILLDTLCYVRVKDTLLSSIISEPDLIAALLESISECFSQFKVLEDNACNNVPNFKKYIRTWLDIIHSFTMHETAISVLGFFRHLVIFNINVILKSFRMLLPISDSTLDIFEKMILILHGIAFQEWSEFQLICGIIPHVIALKAYLKEEAGHLHPPDNYCERLTCVLVCRIERFMRSARTWIDLTPEVDKTTLLGHTRYLISKDLEN